MATNTKSDRTASFRLASLALARAALAVATARNEPALAIASERLALAAKQVFGGRSRRQVESMLARLESIWRAQVRASARAVPGSRAEFRAMTAAWAAAAAYDAAKQATQPA